MNQQRIAQRSPYIMRVDQKGTIGAGAVDPLATTSSHQLKRRQAMNRKMKIHFVVLSALLSLFLAMPKVGNADTKGLSKGHRMVTGVVTSDKGGILTIETLTGTVHLNQKNARQHGHAEYSVGDDVTIVMDGNNSILEAHPKGEEGHHHFYTGKLIHMGKMNKQIKLLTPGGEKIFPLGRLEIKTKPIEEGAMVRVEVNEGGIVIDLHRAESDAHADRPPQSLKR